MFEFVPQVVNNRDSLDSVPIVTLVIPANHPLFAVASEMGLQLHLASMDWDWYEPPGDNYKKRFPGDAWK